MVNQHQMSCEAPVGRSAARMKRWSKLDQLLRNAPGDYSLCVWDAAGRERYAYQPDTVRPSASLIKLPLAMCLLDAAVDHRLDLDEQILVRPSDRVDGEGQLDRGLASEAMWLPVRRLIEHALVESDNTASNVLIELAGMEAVNRWLADHGCTATRLQRRFMDFEAARDGRENLTNARDMCRILLDVRRPRYDALRALLRRAAGEGKLAAGLPPGTPIAHKTGDLPGIEHDAGLIDLPGGCLAVAALSVELPSPEQGRRTIAAAAHMIALMIGEDQEES